jgi:hypothetical protein
MSKAGGAGAEVSPVSGPSYDDHLLLNNDGDDPVTLTIVRRRDGSAASDTVRVDPGATYGVAMPEGDGSTLVEVHCAETTAATSVAPGAHPPLFTYRDGAVLVDRV